MELTPEELKFIKTLSDNPEIAKALKHFQGGTINQYPTKKKKEKTKSQSSYKRKWLTVKEVAEIKGITRAYASTLIKEGFFGKTISKKNGNNRGYSRKVLREVVENTELIGRGKGYDWDCQHDLKQEGKPQAEQETFNYEDLKKQMIEDNKFLLALSREVMRNLKFVTKLDS